MKGTMVEVVKGIKPLPKVVGVRIVIVLIGGGRGGGETPPPMTTMIGLQGLHEKVAYVPSIVTRRTNYHSGEVTSHGSIWIKSNVDKSVIRGLASMKPLASRSETKFSSGVRKSSLKYGSGTVSCVLVASNDPS
jgi:hypothetical protein